MKQRQNESTPIAAAKSGISERSGYRLLGQPVNDTAKPRGRRRPDPLAGIFDEEVVPMLETDAKLRAVDIFTELQHRHPDLKDGVRRTLERRVRDWKTEHGPDQDVIFRQVKEPGRLGISDFTHIGKLKVTVNGRPAPKLLYHFRLPWSGYAHACVVEGGESFTALAGGLETALRELGGAPREHRTDSLSAAFRNIDSCAQEDLTARYEALCSNYGMLPSRNNPGVAHENGAIESPHGHLKSAVDGALRIRGSREFDSIEAWSDFVTETVARRNARRKAEISLEAETLNALPKHPSTSYKVTKVKVSSSSGFVFQKVFYSVPSRLCGRHLRMHAHETTLELFIGKSETLVLPRKRYSQQRHVVNYRHLIHSLKKKPGALPGLAFRDMLFPRDAYRKCYERSLELCGERKACKLTVGLLALAHEENCEAELAQAITCELDSRRLPCLKTMTERFAPRSKVFPEVAVQQASLGAYDKLTGQGGAV